MKILLWLLLALNALVAAVWLSGFSLPAKPPLDAQLPTLTAKRLELLSELPALPPRLDAQPDDSLSGASGPDVVAPAPTSLDGNVPQAVASSEAPVPGATLPSAQPTPAPAAMSPAEPAPEPAQAAALPDALPGPESALGPAPVAAPQAVTVPTSPPDGGAHLSDLPQTGAPPPDAVATPPATPAPSTGLQAGATDTLACYRTAAVAPDANERIGAAVREAKLGEPVLKSQGRPRFWVYWGGSADAVAGVEERLKAAGVKDWYRVGGADTMISLGVYGQADGARRRQRELAAKAIQSRIDERYPPQARLHWQIMALPAAVDAAKADLERRGVRLEACR